MNLIFTKKQEEQKKRIINNVQIDLLYKLVINYLDLKGQDKNQLENKYIIDHFDSLEKLLDIFDRANNDIFKFKELLDKASNVGLPMELEEMNKFLKQKPYYKIIFDSFISFLQLLVNKEIQNIWFLELYNFYEKYNKKTVKSKQEITDYIFQKPIIESNKSFNLKDLSRLVINSFKIDNFFI